jgi:hypothetical protein
MLILLLCAAMVVVWRWPQTPVGRMLHRLLVDWPARKLERLSPAKVLPKLTSGRVLLLLLALLVVVAIALVIAIAGKETMMFLAQGMPEGVAWFAAFDIATYIDVVALGLVLGATVRLRALYSAVTSWAARSAVGRAIRRARGARSRSRRPARIASPPSNDDEPAWAAARLACG